MLTRLPPIALAAALLVSAAPPGSVTSATSATPPPAGPGPTAPSSLQAPTRARPDSLRVFHLTFGPGSEIWERFGHNAIWIHDPAAGTDWGYHYGLFDMSRAGFLFDFVQGLMYYTMGRDPAPALIDYYRRVGRDVSIQELRLAPEQIRELQAFLRWNYRPENRGYRYDYFRDNCSTRIRDALDSALGGTIRDALQPVPSPLTYREQAIALTAEDPILSTAIDVALGPSTDRPISRWDLAFIPMRLRDDLRDIMVVRDGAGRPLVVSERRLPAIGTPDEGLGVPPHERSPRHRTLWLLAAGLLGGAALATAGWLAGRSPWSRGRVAGRAGFGLGGVLLGLAAGVPGMILLAAWLFTDHWGSWANENLLQSNPLALGLVVLVPLAVLGRRATGATRTLAAVLAGLSAAGLLLHFLPITAQENLAVIALALPLYLGLFLGSHLLAELDLRDHAI